MDTCKACGKELGYWDAVKKLSLGWSMYFSIPCKSCGKRNFTCIYNTRRQSVILNLTIFALVAVISIFIIRSFSQLLSFAKIGLARDIVMLITVALISGFISTFLIPNFLRFSLESNEKSKRWQARRAGAVLIVLAVVTVALYFSKDILKARFDASGRLIILGIAGIITFVAILFIKNHFDKLESQEREE